MLQKAYFDRHPQIASLRKSGGGTPAGQAIETAIGTVYANPERRRDGDLDAAAELWRGAISDAVSTGRLPVFSWERLTRHFYYESPTDQRLPKTLKKVVGEARIVIVIRHQIHLLESRYLSSIKPPTYVTPEEWLDDEGERSLPAYFYADTITGYQETFGTDNVLVLLFEELGADPEGFGERLSSFMGVDPALGAGLLSGAPKNRRPSAYTQAYSRMRTRFLPGVSLGRFLPRSAMDRMNWFMARGRGGKAEFPRKRIAALEDRYREQNRRVASRFDLDMARYDYPL